MCFGLSRQLLAIAAMESLNYQLFTFSLTQVVNAIIISKSTIASVFQSVREVLIHICISNK